MKKYYTIHTIWLMMIFLTLTTYAMGKAGYSGTFVVMILLGTSTLKGYFIISEFMELRGVSLLWRAMMYGWLWSIIISIIIIYVASN